MTTFTIRRLVATDYPGLERFFEQHWGEARMVVHGNVYLPHELEGFAAEADEQWAGVVTFYHTGDTTEVMSLDSLRPGQGIGTALMQAVASQALAHGSSRLWLETTNDNTHALRFFQKRGYTLAAIRRNAVEEARKLKPGIPLIGYDGIPIRDEIELELLLERDQRRTTNDES